MKIYAILTALCVAACGSGALAADLDVLAPTPMQASGPRWDGFSIGVNGGGLWAPGLTETQVLFPGDFAIPGVPTSYKFSSYGGLIGAQTGFNKQFGSFVVGAVADYDFAIGATARQAASGPYFGTTYFTGQSEQLQSLGTIRGRIGFTPMDDVLIFATGGLAFGETAIKSSLSFGAGGANPGLAGSRNQLAVGFAAGGGVEYALGPQWSLGLEGLYYNLGPAHVASLPQFGIPAGFASPETDSTFAFSGYTLRLSLNYEFDSTSTEASARPSSSDPTSEIATTVGVRAGMSTSRVKTSLYDFTGSTLLSQLTYHNPNAATAEIYATFDHPSSGFFLKGYVGVGKESGGSLQDEDFPPFTQPYSSTSSPQNDGRLGYANIDFGYYALQSDWYKLGGLVGYHYLDESYNAFGCTQTATNPDICSSGSVGPANLTISDDGRWNSFRLGLAGQLTLPAGFSARAEAAWLPYMSFNGGNDHWLRDVSDFSGTIPQSGTGSNGYQLEAEINYALSRNFDVGVGGRYWSMNARGHWLFQDVTADGGPQVATFSTQRAQAFVQTAYHF